MYEVISMKEAIAGAEYVRIRTDIQKAYLPILIFWTCNITLDKIRAAINITLTWKLHQLKGAFMQISMLRNGA